VLSPRARKLTLSLHLTVSVGWIGAVLAYLGLGLTAVRSDEIEQIRGMWSAMDAVGWYVIVPLAGASLVTGVIMALGTKWGLFRHYWVVISFVLTSLSVLILVFHMPTVTSTADFARTADLTELEGLGGDLGHPAIGLLVLLVIQVLNIYKPAGLTRYGWRKQQTARSTPPPTG
jgi:hypothetical protein